MLNDKVIMSQDGDALVAMEANAAQYPSAIASVVSDEEYTRLTLPEPPTYQELRQEAYPSTGDQLDYIYHNGVAKWKTDMIDPVKDKYPKE
jgi:hypothetical protein